MEEAPVVSRTLEGYIELENSSQRISEMGIFLRHYYDGTSRNDTKRSFQARVWMVSIALYRLINYNMYQFITFNWDYVNTVCIKYDAIQHKRTSYRTFTTILDIYNNVSAYVHMPYSAHDWLMDTAITSACDTIVYCLSVRYAHLLHFEYVTWIQYLFITYIFCCSILLLYVDIMLALAQGVGIKKMKFCYQVPHNSL